MAATIIATPGASDANSFATLAEANTYHEAHVSGAAWADLDADARNRALIMATRHITAYAVWLGAPSSSSQALPFPRTGLVNPDNGAAVSSSTIPDRLKWATAEQARLLATADRSQEQGTAVQGITAIKAGSVELEFAKATTPGGIGQVVAPSAWQFIACWGYLEQQGMGGAVKLARV